MSAPAPSTPCRPIWSASPPPAASAQSRAHPRTPPWPLPRAGGERTFISERWRQEAVGSSAHYAASRGRGRIPAHSCMCACSPAIDTPSEQSASGSGASSCECSERSAWTHSIARPKSDRSECTQIRHSRTSHCAGTELASRASCARQGRGPWAGACDDLGGWVGM